MIEDVLRQGRLAMRAEDMRVRQELAESGQLGDGYVPRMEAVHIANATRLRELIARHGWPGESIAGKDGAEAAWLVVQHAIGEPEFQREMLHLIQACAAAKRVPLARCLSGRSNCNAPGGRPQLYGTQWIDDPRDGRLRPWRLAEPDRIDELREAVGLGPLRPIPEPGPDLPPKSGERSQKIGSGGSAGSATKVGGANNSTAGDSAKSNPSRDRRRQFRGATPVTSPGRCCTQKDSATVANDTAPWDCEPQR